MVVLGQLCEEHDSDEYWINLTIMNVGLTWQSRTWFSSFSEYLCSFDTIEYIDQIMNVNFCSSNAPHRPHVNHSV
uniref:Uncharacterized protein n=1 Tax=Arion vulgaris TaxID=1028688 RepID=A0A0B6ZHH1_9EUPU